MSDKNADYAEPLKINFSDLKSHFPIRITSLSVEAVVPTVKRLMRFFREFYVATRYIRSLGLNVTTTSFRKQTHVNQIKRHYALAAWESRHYALFVNEIGSL
jgi:hypothetical protein